jgi:hypothetical protein
MMKFINAPDKPTKENFTSLTNICFFKSEIIGYLTMIIYTFKRYIFI